MRTRRQFVAAAAAFAASRLPGQSARIDVASVERPRVLADAKPALTASPTGTRDVSATLATLTAAFLLTKDEAFATRARTHLLTLTKTNTKPDVPITDLIPLAEAAVALRFLVDAIPQADLDAINAFFVSLNQQLNTDLPRRIERDKHDHRGSAWLLISAAIARSQRDTSSQATLSARFRKPTLRNQIKPDGSFPEEMATPNPYRNTLFNFDLLCGTCQLLASPFNPLWDFELTDGLGMRVVAAALFPMIANRDKWTGVSDQQHFRELPGRRNGLLFAGRAYNRPEYVDLWRATPAAVPPDLADTFPIREPLLWVERPLHGY